MRQIPQSLKDELAADPYYQKCCLDYTGMCEGRIEWHHALLYGGRQQNRKFCILPLCHGHHLRAENREIKAKLEAIMVSRATAEDLAEYPRRQWNK